MKKFICIIASVILSMVVVGCNNGSTEGSSQTENISDIQSSTQQSVENDTQPSEESSSQAQESSDEILQDNDESSIVLPEGVTEDINGNKLKYTNSVLSLSVTFPSDFCILNNDYTPVYGIYLQNTEGTATLILESVEDTTTNPTDLAAALSDMYPDTEVYITDYRDVVCKRTYTDRNGNEVMSFLKVRTKTGGYNEILLTFSADQKDEFEAIFNQINFS